MVASEKSLLGYRNLGEKTSFAYRLIPHPLERENEAESGMEENFVGFMVPILQRV